jgi:hypothetical protein
MNMIGAMLAKKPPAFEPILYEGELEGGGTIVMAHDWYAMIGVPGSWQGLSLPTTIGGRSWATSPIARYSSRS